MASGSVLAVVKFRDGQRQKICVKVENNLTSLINGINELNINVSRLLSEMVDQEKAGEHCAEGEEDYDSSEDQDPEDPKISKQPPAKRSKTSNL
uniref:Uncharacterized protein n=1 Tax=Mastacembelus armatus TaxID=205130 RepID=A0A3Q3KV56_9TELE